MWRCLRGVLAVVLAASLSTACGDDDDRRAIPAGAERTSATDEVEEALEVAVERSRLFEQQRALAVTVRNAGDAPVVLGPRQARGSLEIEALDDRDVALVDITTSSVFVTEVPESSREEGAAVLEVFAARCDTHALIESKKTFTFTASVAVDGDEPVPVELVPGPGPAREALQQALEGCIEAGDGG